MELETDFDSRFWGIEAAGDSCVLKPKFHFADFATRSMTRPGESQPTLATAGFLVSRFPCVYNAVIWLLYSC